MSEAHLFAIGVLLAWLAGIRVYLTVFGVGLAGAFGWLDLPQALQVTQSPWVMGISGALAAVERPATAPELPIDVAGTAFQEAVWRELRKIPPGETRSYAQIAAAVGKPGAVRAAGSANGANHVAVLIPCHRVVRSDGSLGGYAGGIDRKRKLLEAEQATAQRSLKL
jgi:AraC family transcriptional regulator of adaptative response/methylated-DNA-[protein]-cysteine methyltransferase